MLHKKISLICGGMLILLIGSIVYLSTEKDNETLDNKTNEEIKEHYNKYVITNNETKLYELLNGKYIEKGYISKNIELELMDKQVDDKEYFQIKSNDINYYVYYKDITPIDNLNVKDNRYKNYIVFNENVVTNNLTIFYDEKDNELYRINQSYTLPIIIKDGNKYGVEFNKELVYLKKDNVKEVIKSNNTELKNSSGIGVLNYHAFYDENNLEEKNDCTTEICHSKTQFKSHLEYIKENNILSVTAKEVEMYIDGEIQLPKSVFITIDDGGKTDVAIDLLEKYKMNATIFLVTSWFDPSSYRKSEYIEFHSHTHNMHNGGKCPGGQGGEIKCLPEEEILSDLKASREVLNGSTVFCYPFYEYNDYAINLVKEAGFTMAFIGESNNSDNLVHVGSDKFKLRRFVIVTYTTIDDLDKYFDQIK